MLYGDLVTLTPGGVMLGSKAVLPVGIFDNSICWGVWVRDATKPEQEHNAHLVLSPLHPRYWPYLLRFELKLKEDAGSMAAAARMLEAHRMNIQFGESSASGHHHATWNVVCEAVDVRSRFERRIQAFKGRKGHRSDRRQLNTLATELAEAMYLAAHNVREAMIHQGRFLHERIVKDKPKLLHDVARIRDPNARAAAQEDTLRPVRVRWIQNLPKFSFYAVDALHPQAFRYDQARSILHAEQQDDFERVLRAQGLTDLPTRATASIYPEEHHIRLIPRHKRHLKHVVQIDLHYNARFSSPGTPAEPGADTTMGLWADVCEKLAHHGLNLQRVTNKTVRNEASTEEGVLTLIGIREERSESLDIPVVTADLLNLPPDMRSRIHLDPPSISQLHVEQVFISWRRNAPGFKRLLELVEKGARAYGLNPIIVDSPMTPNLESYIREKIRACSVMLQVVNLSRDELRLLDTERREGRPRLHWFSFEYGVAIERDMPVVRLVDASVMGIPEWKEELATGAGGVLIPFDSRDPDSMEEEIDRAMQALAAYVHHEPVES